MMLENNECKVLVRMPRKALQSVVKRFLIVESTAARQDLHLPDTGLAAAFCFSGECRLDDGTHAPRAAITGLFDTVRAHRHSEGHAVVIAAFTPTGAAALLRHPLDEFTNATVDLDDVLGRGAALGRLHDQLVTVANHEQRIGLVEDLLLAQAGDRRPDARVAAAIGYIERTKGMLRIDALARQVGLSQSALERRFRRFVGATPRRFASLVRLQSVMRLHAAGADLTTIAHAAGFCDQSHFIKEFRRMTGVSPGSFFSRQLPA